MSERYTEAELALLSDTEREALTATDVDDEGLAEIAGQYLKKGKPVYIEGRLKTRKWTDKDGAEKYTTEIIANEMTMLGGNDVEQKPQQTHSQQRQAAAKAVTGFDGMADDIPF